MACRQREENWKEEGNGLQVEEKLTSGRASEGKLDLGRETRVV